MSDHLYTILEEISDERIRQDAKFGEICQEISDERIRQDAKFGDQSRKHLGGWLAILAEEFGEACREICEIIFCKRHYKDFLISSGKNLRKELIQTAAVCVAIVEAGDRYGWHNWPDEQQCQRPERRGE